MFNRDVACSDTDFNGLPSEVEYRETIFTTPEIQPGGLNIFQGLIDDSMLNHGQKVSIYVSGAMVRAQWPWAVVSLP